MNELPRVLFVIVSRRSAAKGPLANPARPCQRKP